jgi:hypothetical protein
MVTEKLLATIAKKMKICVEIHGAVPATCIGVLPDDTAHNVKVDFDCLYDDPDLAADLLARKLQGGGYVAYALVVQCWFVPPSWTEYPALCPDRNYKISVIAADRSRSISRAWKKSKSSRDLWQLPDDEAGRFSDLLNRPWTNANVAA